MISGRGAVGGSETAGAGSGAVGGLGMRLGPCSTIGRRGRSQLIFVGVFFLVVVEVAP